MQGWHETYSFDVQSVTIVLIKSIMILIL